MRVGLTGGIASGKSTVSAILRELGAVVIDADQLARDVVAPGTDGLRQVVEAFGPEVLTADGRMDRPAVGALVFADPAKRQVLEAIIWPLVGALSQRLVEEAPEGALIVNDVPLLVETGQQTLYDAVIVVDVPTELQVARLLRDRGMTEEDALSRIGAQATREQRLAVATYVIENTGTREDLRQRVTEVFEQLL